MSLGVPAIAASTKKIIGTNAQTRKLLAVQSCVCALTDVEKIALAIGSKDGSVTIAQWNSESLGDSPKIKGERIELGGYTILLQ